MLRSLVGSEMCIRDRLSSSRRRFPGWTESYLAYRGLWTLVFGLAGRSIPAASERGSDGPEGGA